MEMGDGAHVYAAATMLLFTPFCRVFFGWRGGEGGGQGETTEAIRLRVR